MISFIIRLIVQQQSEKWHVSKVLMIPSFFKGNDRQEATTAKKKYHNTHS